MKLFPSAAVAATFWCCSGGGGGVAADDGFPMKVHPRAWVLDQAGFADPTSLAALHWPEDDLDDLAGRPKTAISFSGGGTRAFVAGLGYLRAIIDLGLMPTVRYLSGISGGSWAASAFTFFEKKYTTSIPYYLGNISDPADLTMDALKSIPAGCGRRSVVDKNLIDVCLGLLVHSDDLGEIWRDAVYEVYLEPAGVPKRALVTWDSHTLRDILERNPDLADSANTTWAMPCAGNCSASVVGRPFPLFGGTLLGPSALVPLDIKHRSYTMQELTPLYTGQAVVQNVTYNGNGGVFSKDKHQTVQVGGFTEAFAFSSSPPPAGLPAGATAGVLHNATLVEQGTTIEDMAGISSWALADFVSTLLPLAKKLDITIPTWFPASGGAPPPSNDFDYGDGGCVDNLNLPSILRRGVTRVVLFYTSSHPLSPADKWDPFNQTSDKDINGHVDSEFPAYFGHHVDPGGNKSVGWDYSRNAFFDKADFAPTIAKLQAAQATGRGAVATTPLTTVRNDWFGVPAGLHVNVTWVYLSRASAWEAALPEETRKHVLPDLHPDDPSKTPSLGPFANFPHYNTFTQLHLTASQSNLLADLAGWVVQQNKDLFTAALGAE